MTSEGESKADLGTVLLVDDEPALRRALARALTRAGHVVVEAGDGREAAALLRKASYDVIVSDINMPEMDGMHLLRAVREQDLDVPVILMTGLPEVGTAMQAMEYGAFKYLSKPVDMAVFTHLVKQAIQVHRMATLKREALVLLGRESDAAGDRAGLELAFDRMLGGLWMAYQPIVHRTTHALYGYEALLRSSEPSLPHPGAVLGAAEKLHRLDELGRCVRERAVAPMVAAPERGFLFVNLHTQDLRDETLLSKDSPLSAIAERVVLEITERASLDEVKDAPARVAALRAMGFRIAIDDLGAGYAGLTAFAQLEPELVKLDMSLIRDVDKGTVKQRLIRSMVSLCRDMGILVVAEGVETKAELAVLEELGCDLLQGYLLAKPGRPFPEIAPLHR